MSSKKVLQDGSGAVVKTVALPDPDDDPSVPTAASAWKRQSTEGELYRLPGSGNVARLRRPSLMAMVTQAGHVPNPVSDNVVRLMSDGIPDAIAEPDEAKRAALYRQNSAAMVEIAKLCFVEPRVVDGDANYDAGEIAVSDLSDRDVMFCYFTVVLGDAEKLATFRVDRGA